MPKEPTAPNMRTFTLNSPEFYEAVCTPRQRPWIPNGALPREPRMWDLPVIVEARGASGLQPRRSTFGKLAKRGNK